MNDQQASQVQFHVDLNKILSKSHGKARDSVLRRILIVIHALLNTEGGGMLELLFHDQESEAKDKFTRMIEQKLISTIGTQTVSSYITFKHFRDDVTHCEVKMSGTFITTNYNLYVPCETQANLIPSTENIDAILNRQNIPQPVLIHSHKNKFTIDIKCGFTENKNTEFKWLTAGPSKRTTLADRMTCKGNKFSCYVSAFANHSGGHIYYGITDNEVVKGEFIPNEDDMKEIVKKIEKSVNKLIWPEQIGKPKRGEHWEIFFEPVQDGIRNSEPVPSTFVIVIYIAACLGGVFTEEPESYELVDGKAQKLSFENWKKRIPQPLCCKAIIPHSIPRVTWSSDVVRKTFCVGSEKLRKLINNGGWNALSKECQNLLKQSQDEMKLLVLSKQVTACYRTGRFSDARAFLDQYMTILPQVKDILIFEVVGLHLEAALKRATGDFNGLKEALTAALSKAELIEPGLVTTTVYAFAAIVSDLIDLEEPTSGKSSPDILSKRALEHSKHVKDCPDFHEDKAQKVHIMLATYYLGCNLSGQPVKDSIDTSDLDKAKASIMEVHRSTCEGNPPSKYREVQLKLVQSINSYRHSQISEISPEKRVVLLRSAFESAKEAERLSKKYKFTEMLEWSKRNEALCTEELVRAKFANNN